MSAGNVCVWFVGADDGSTGYEVILEQDDGSHHGLFRIEPDGDPTAIGMMIGSLDWNRAQGSRWMHTAKLPPARQK